MSPSTALTLWSDDIAVLGSVFDSTSFPDFCDYVSDIVRDANTDIQSFVKYVKTMSSTRVPLPLSCLSTAMTWSSGRTQTLCSGSSTCLFYVPGTLSAADYVDHEQNRVWVTVLCLSEADNDVLVNLPVAAEASVSGVSDIGAFTATGVPACIRSPSVHPHSTPCDWLDFVHVDDILLLECVYTRTRIAKTRKWEYRFRLDELTFLYRK